MRIGTKSLLDCLSIQAGWSSVFSPLEGLDQHHLSLGCEVRLLRHPALPLVHQLFPVRTLYTFLLWSYIFICSADLMMRRIAMKYKTSSTSSLHWYGAWGDTFGGKLALRAALAGGRRHKFCHNNNKVFSSTRHLSLLSLNPDVTQNIPIMSSHFEKYHRRWR